MDTYRIVLRFFFNDTAPTEIYTLSLHDALPILSPELIPMRILTRRPASSRKSASRTACWQASAARQQSRSEEHTSELQSQFHLVCRLLLEKKKNHRHQILDDITYRLDRPDRRLL